MKLETTKAFMHKWGMGTAYLGCGAMDGEYFFLSEAMSVAIDEFLEKSGSELDYTSIADLKLPFDKFSIETRIPDAYDVAKKCPPSRFQSYARVVSYERVGDQIFCTVLDRMANARTDAALPYCSTYIITDLTEQNQKECLIIGGRDWSYSLASHWDNDREDPVYGVGVATWAPSFEKYYDDLEDDFWSREVIDRELKSGPRLAVQGLLTAISLSLVRSGVTKRKADCSVIERKVSGKKKTKRTRKHFFTAIMLDAVDRISGNQITARDGVSAHTVRGHFKKRKTGLFWWNPFVRGSGKVQEREAYTVG